MNHSISNNAKRSILVAALVAATLTGCAQDGGPPLIELGDGRFQIELDPRVGTAAPAWLGGAIEWEYAGQATYVRPGDRELFAAERQSLTGDDGVADTATRLLGSTMEDEHGRLFRVRSIDRARLAAAIAGYDARVARDFGVEATGVDREGDLDPEPDAAAARDYTPLTWHRIDQDGDGDEDLFRWDGDDRNLVSSPLTARQDKALIYFLGDIGFDARSCTAVLVDDYWVLTAAHCVKDDSGNNWIYADGAGEARRGKVCTRGNYYAGADCANVTGRWGNGSYGGSGDMGDDIVVMRIDEPLGQGNYMAMSAASNSTLKDHDAYNLGHPGLTPGGSANVFSCGVLLTGDSYAGDTADSVAPCESRMYWSADEVTYTSTKVIGTRVDMSSGHSGGPIYYYPNGVSPTASHFLTGIVSGHHDGVFENYNGGAKIPYHRGWVLGIIN